MKYKSTILVWLIPYLFSIYEYWFQSMPSVMMGYLHTHMHLSVSQIGYLGAGFFYLYIGLQIPSGYLVDKIKPKLLLSICILIFCIGEVVYATSTGFWQALFGRALLGLGSAPAVACAFWMAARWNPPQVYSKIIGIMEGLVMVAGGIGLYVLARAIEKLGFLNTSWVFLIIGLILWIGTIIYVRNDPPDAKKHIVQASLWAQTKKVASYSQVWILGLYSGCQYAIMGSVAILWGVAFAKTAYHLPTSLAAWLIAMIYFGAALGAPVFGYLNTKFKDVRYLMGLTSLVTIIIFSIWVFARLTPHLFMLCSFLIGMCASSYVLSFIHIRHAVPTECRGTAIGLVNVLACVIGAPILQIIIGHLLTGNKNHLTILNFHHAFLAVFPVLILGGVMSYFVKIKAEYVFTSAAIL